MERERCTVVLGVPTIYKLLMEAAVGIFVLRGALWAGIVGIGIAGLSALANFLWLPYYPVWAILIITLDVIIIWALAAHRESIHLIDR